MNQVVQVHLFYPSIITFGGRGIRDPLIYSQLSSDLWAVRLEDGDDILMSLRRFVEVKRIRAGLLEGIGSLKKVGLGYYDFETLSILGRCLKRIWRFSISPGTCRRRMLDTFRMFMWLWDERISRFLGVILTMDHRLTWSRFLFVDCLVSL